MPFTHLFAPGMIGKQEVKNRIVMSPMGENLANADGSVSEQSIAYYEERAKGGAGIIIPGVFSVDYPRGKTVTYQHRIDEFKYVSGLKRLADAIHRHDALLIPQIHHAGGQTNIRTTEGVTPICVSDSDDIQHLFIKANRAAGPQREMTIEDIHEVRDKFIQSAIYCSEARCDGVELHAAHGYLISAFLSPDTNKRTDEYGGTLENRMRFLLEILEGIRKACGPAFIIGARIPGVEWVSGGLTQQECIQIAKALEENGCDYLNVSGGASDKVGNLLEPQTRKQGDRVVYAANIKKEVQIPVMAVGVLREPAFCDEIIESGQTDYVLLGRQLLCDPYWPEKAQNGKAHTIRKCISCMDGCSDNNNFGRPVTCTLNPVVGYEREYSPLPKTEKPRNVVVIGGGPAGMQAAITAAEIGHDVTLFEKGTSLGGQLNLASIPPDKQIINWATDWFVGEVGRQRIDVRLNTAANIDDIKALKPDEVIFAAGATPFTPNIPGIENCVSAWDILNSTIPLPAGKSVVLVGGGIVACEVAGFLAEAGNTVTIVEMLSDVALSMEGTNRQEMLEKLQAHDVQFVTNAVVTEITASTVTYKSHDETHSLETDMIVKSIGQKPTELGLFKQIKEAGIPVRKVGDVKRPAKILNAVSQGFFAAIDI